MKRVIENLGQWIALTMLVTQRFEKRHEPFTIIIKRAPKTLEQLGYFHSEVLPKLTIALFEAGEIPQNDEGHAKYWLKQKVGFGEWIEFGNGSVVFNPASFEDAKIDDIMHAIDIAIHEANERGVYVAPPRKNLRKKTLKNK